MPVQDDSGKVVGTVLYEDSTSGNYSVCFVSICFTNQMMKLYSAEAEVSSVCVCVCLNLVLMYMHGWLQSRFCAA